MACNEMLQGESVKITKLKEAALAKAKAQVLMPKAVAGLKAWEERVRELIRRGAPAITDKIGNGPGHEHVFKWPCGTTVQVDLVEYQKVYNTGSVNRS